MFNTSALDFIKESANNISDGVDSMNESMIINSILEDVNELDEIDVDIVYSPEMVPLIEVYKPLGSEYIVEHENLLKLVRYYENKGAICNEEIAIERLAEHYDIPQGNIVLLIESDETYRKNVFMLTEKIRKEKNPERKHVLKMKLNDMKEKMRRMKDNKKLKMIRNRNGKNKK